MKSYRKELWFVVPHRRQIVHIIPTVERCLEESGIQEKFITTRPPHDYCLDV